MSSTVKEITLLEVKKHNTPEDLWMVIHNKVYDLTKFRSEHPGGDDVLDEWAGKEASKAFDDVGHSSDAVILYILGLTLSGYAFYVETRAEHENDYKALCDISEKMSCSKVFLSEYGKGFGIIGTVPNGLLGIGFYSFMILMSFWNTLISSKVQLFLSSISNLMSVYLAYLLYFVLEDLCVVCVSTYLVNFLILLKLVFMARLKSKVE